MAMAGIGEDAALLEKDDPKAGIFVSIGSPAFATFRMNLQHDHDYRFIGAQRNDACWRKSNRPEASVSPLT